MRNLIRATLGWPSAYTYHRKIMLKVLAAEVIDRETALPAGTISHIGKEGISVAAGEGILTITRVKPQGKGEMSAWSFACGYRVKNGELFSEQARP
jgi:methionyl-tRNA formyltransferase